MKLIFIYGPPAAGKYTVGRELARLTGYRFFHNHLTVDAVTAIFPEDDALRARITKKIRLIMLREAAKAGRNTIFTLAYSGAVDDVFVRRIVDNVEKYGGEVCFVQLYAPSEELKKRVIAESRQRMGKIHEEKKLQFKLDTRDHYATVKYPQNLRIDTSKLPAQEVAAKIIKHYKLATL